MEIQIINYVNLSHFFVLYYKKHAMIKVKDIIIFNTPGISFSHITHDIMWVANPTVAAG